MRTALIILAIAIVAVSLLLVILFCLIRAFILRARESNETEVDIPKAKDPRDIPQYPAGMTQEDI